MPLTKRERVDLWKYVGAYRAFHHAWNVLAEFERRPELQTDPALQLTATAFTHSITVSYMRPFTMAHVPEFSTKEQVFTESDVPAAMLNQHLEFKRLRHCVIAHLDGSVNSSPYPLVIREVDIPRDDWLGMPAPAGSKNIPAWKRLIGHFKDLANQRRMALISREARPANGVYYLDYTSRSMWSPMPIEIQQRFPSVNGRRFSRREI